MRGLNDAYYVKQHLQQLKILIYDLKTINVHLKMLA